MAPRFWDCSRDFGWDRSAKKNQGSRPRSRLFRLPGLRLPLVHLVSAEQKNVDQLLCARGRRLVARRFCVGLLGSGTQGLGQGERQKSQQRPRQPEALWPWLVFGSNAIAAYMVSELLPGISELFPFYRGRTEDGRLRLAPQSLFELLPDPAWAAFAYSLLFTAVCFIPVWVLYRNKIFLKV